MPVENKWDDENDPRLCLAVVHSGRRAGSAVGIAIGAHSNGRKAFSNPPSETIRMLWTNWLTTTIIDELSRVECVKGQTGKGKHGLTTVAPRRNAIADALTECPAGA